MILRRQVTLWLLGALIVINSSLPTLAEQSKPIYVISDLHMGVGKVTDKITGDDCKSQVSKGAWHCLEDFRWPEALKAFLLKISNDNPAGVDLVIAGDLLDLLQHPTIRRPIPPAKGEEECGYSVEEMKRIVTDVLAGHKEEFGSMRLFLASGVNRIFVMPGNHDAALFEDKIWKLVSEAIPQGRDRFLRWTSETWFSADGAIAIEHGHQNPWDINKFPGWPASVTKECPDSKRFYRPWGELFMEALYNDAERELPLIDNLVPDSQGISVYSEHAKQEGTFLEDLAKFVLFNVLQTSRYQKLTVLEVDKDKNSLKPIKIDINFCKCCIGEDLILRSPEGQSYNSLAGTAGSKEQKKFRLALREQVRSLDDGAVKELCLREMVAEEGKLTPNPDLRDEPGCSEKLAMAKRMIGDRDGTHLLEQRLTILRQQKEGLRFYFFGHTHEAKTGTPVVIPEGIFQGRRVTAFNSGAFQRLIDKDFLEASKKEENGKAPKEQFTKEDTASQRLKESDFKKKESDVAVLGRLTHEDMKPCYPVLAVTYDAKNNPTVRLKQWYKKEDVSDKGEFLDACDLRCSARPANCPKE